MSLITWSPTDKSTDLILTNKNLTAKGATLLKYLGVRVNSPSIAEKAYAEFTIDNIDNRVCIGVIDSQVNLNDFGSGLPSMPVGIKVLANSGIIYNGSITIPNGTFVTGDIIGVLYDKTTKNVQFRKNGVNIYSLKLDSTLDWKLGVLVFNSLDVCTANFGASPFKYEIPSGYLPYDTENASWLNPNKYLFQCNDNILKPTMNGLELVEGTLNTQLFEEHGTEYLPNIIGQYDKEVDMVYKEDLEGKKIYGYKLIGYRNIDRLAIS